MALSSRASAPSLLNISALKAGEGCLKASISDGLEIRAYVSCLWNSVDIVSSFGGSQGRQRRRGSRMVPRMAPDEEKMTRRSPLDFPVEWDRPGPARRPDIFPQFSPMRPPLPQPLPADPPEEDEEEGEKENEPDPDKDPDQPEE